MSDDDGRLLFYSFIGFGGGIYLFFKGFRRFRQYRVVADTPEIPIRSMPMGLVHIRGQARCDEMLTSPITRTPCYLYQVVVEEWHSDSEGGGHWNHVVTDLQTVKFYLEDTSGNVLVDATDAELDLPRHSQREVRASVGASQLGPGNGHATDAEVCQFIEQARARRIGHLVDKGIGLLTHSDSVSPSPAKGFLNFLAHPTETGAAGIQAQMASAILAKRDPNRQVTRAALEVWKHPQGTPEFQAAFTALGMIAARVLGSEKAASAFIRNPENPAQGLRTSALVAVSAGAQSDPELERARLAAVAYTQNHGPGRQGRGSASGHFRLSEYCLLPGEIYDLTGTCAENPNLRDSFDRHIILKGENEPTFLISSRTQKQVESHLGKDAALMIFGGAGLAVVCLAIILAKFGLL